MSKDKYLGMWESHAARIYHQSFITIDLEIKRGSIYLHFERYTFQSGFCSSAGVEKSLHTAVEPAVLAAVQN